MKKLVSILLTLGLVVSFVMAVPVGAADSNTIGSSTMVFQGDLTDNGDGSYSGTIPLTAGFDVYARDGATAAFWDSPSEQRFPTIAGHDGWPAFDPDTADVAYYALTLEDNTWKLVYNEDTPRDWENTGGVPMSGTMDWNAMYASETNLGYCFGDDVEHVGALPADGNYGWAGANGGGPACWDMDWGDWLFSEVVPLQFPGFDVEIEDLGSDYCVTLTPAEATTTSLAAEVPDIVAISVNPSFIDFGTLLPNQTSDVFDITVENIGTHTADVDADVSGSALFRGNLELKNHTTGTSWKTRAWPTIVDDLAMGGSEVLRTKLPVPSGYTPKGVETGTLVFTARPA